MITRLLVALAFVAMLLSAGTVPGHAQEGIEGDVTACSDLGGGSVDADTIVTVTADDGTFISYTATVAVIAVITGDGDSNVYPAAVAGDALHAPRDSHGDLPAIDRYIFCSVPDDGQPVDDDDPVDEEPGTCPGGADGYPECNPQIDAEVNLSADCVARTPDGTYTVTGVFSVTNQSEHAQGIRITEVVGPTLDSESFFLGQEIANGATLSYPFQATWIAGDDPDAMMVVSTSVMFESTEGRGTVREPRGDVEEFSLDGPCAVGDPIDEQPICEIDPSLCEQPTCEADPTLCEGPVDVEPVTPEPVDEVATGGEPAVGTGEVVVALPNTGAGLVESTNDYPTPIAFLVIALAGCAMAYGLRFQRSR